MTGATGFIGRHLFAKLREQGGAVRGTLWTQEPATILPSGVMRVLVDSIGPETDWGDALAGVDTVFHLAARVHVMKETTEDPLALYRLVNVAGTERLARRAAAAGVRRLVFLSSVKVHGEETEAFYNETSPLAPTDPYGVSKREGEEVLGRIGRETGLEVVIIRPPLVYGPGVKANFLGLMRGVAQGWPLPLASITNRRSLIYVGNLVDALVICGTAPQAAGKTYLVSDGKDVSTADLIRRLASALGRPARLFACPLALLTLAGKVTGRTSAIDRLVGSLRVDMTKIGRELGWHPPHTLEEGLQQTAAWYRGGSPAN